MIITPRKKYRVGGNAKRTPYRTRTGPVCCTINCPAKKTKRTSKKSGLYG